MVSFTQIPYSEVMRRWNRQTQLLQVGSELGIAVGVLAVVFAVARLVGVKVGVGAGLDGRERMWWFPWR